MSNAQNELTFEAFMSKNICGTKIQQDLLKLSDEIDYQSSRLQRAKSTSQQNMIYVNIKGYELLYNQDQKSMRLKKDDLREAEEEFKEKCLEHFGERDEVSCNTDYMVLSDQAIESISYSDMPHFFNIFCEAET